MITGTTDDPFSGEVMALLFRRVDRGTDSLQLKGNRTSDFPGSRALLLQKAQNCETELRFFAEEGEVAAIAGQFQGFGLQEAGENVGRARIDHMVLPGGDGENLRLYGACR